MHRSNSDIVCNDYDYETVCDKECDKGCDKECALVCCIIIGFHAIFIVFLLHLISREDSGSLIM